MAQRWQLRTDDFQVAWFKSDRDRWADVGFMWLAADSPVTDLSKADRSKRSDVALYADVIGEGSTAFTTLIVLKFGSAAVAVCDGNDLDLQVTATDAGADTVTLRVRYGKSAEVQVTNQDHRTWTVVLHPDRMQGASS